RSAGGSDGFSSDLACGRADSMYAGCGKGSKDEAASRFTFGVAGSGCRVLGLRPTGLAPPFLRPAFGATPNKGVAMKRYALILCATLGIVLSGGVAQAGWCSKCTYSGYQPWWNICAHRQKCLTPEEERLQHFWHDYYDALKNYYAALDRMDWV